MRSWLSLMASSVPSDPRTFGDLVQVDIQAVGQLTDGNGNAAGTKVVAALDHLAGVLAAEQALQLALDGRIALLHLRTAVLKAVQLVRLGGTGSTADAVTAGAARPAARSHRREQGHSRRTWKQG